MQIGPLDCVTLMRPKSSCFWVLKLKPDFNVLRGSWSWDFSRAGCRAVAPSTSHRRPSSGCLLEDLSFATDTAAVTTEVDSPSEPSRPAEQRKMTVPHTRSDQQILEKKINKRIPCYPALKMKPPLIEQVLNAPSNVVRWREDLRREVTLLWVELTSTASASRRREEPPVRNALELLSGRESHQQRKHIKAFSAPPPPPSTLSMWIKSLFTDFMLNYETVFSN